MLCVFVVGFQFAQDNQCVKIYMLLGLNYLWLGTRILFNFVRSCVFQLHFLQCIPAIWYWRIAALCHNWFFYIKHSTWDFMGFTKINFLVSIYDDYFAFQSFWDLLF